MGPEDRAGGLPRVKVVDGGLPSLVYLPPAGSAPTSWSCAAQAIFSCSDALANSTTKVSPVLTSTVPLLGPAGPRPGE